MATTLDRDLRSTLERTTKTARKLAEEAAQIALEKLAVPAPEALATMSEEQKKLRRALRALGRAQGDKQEKNAAQEVTRLRQYIAYEYWHRLLFARFLGENELLLYDGVGISLEECAELIEEPGSYIPENDPFEFASRLAADALPQIFRRDDPSRELTFDLRRARELREMVLKLPRPIFLASDSLGWVYQFWQTDAKKAANDSNEKINADTLPPVTQLFTEPYMVSFLVDNSLGAWWLRNEREFASPESAPTERDFPYLRDPATEAETPDEESDEPAPFAETRYEGWPKTAKELKILDPSMGSGHFLVHLLPLLVRMRMAEEGLSRLDAIHAVLADNLHGLEIDPRCSEIAAFALAFSAWKLEPQCLGQPLPSLNLACCGLRIKEDKNRWLQLVEDEDQKYAMELLYDLFVQAPELGSLINPDRKFGELEKAPDLDVLLPVIEKTQVRNRKGGLFEEAESGVTAGGLAAAYPLLTGKYHLIITNVPYLARGKHGEKLKAYCEKYYNDAKNDLATVFVERCLEYCEAGSTVLVTPQNWLFLTSYKKLRKGLLEDRRFEWIARLGPRAFETISGEVVNVAFTSISKLTPEKKHIYWGVDVSDETTPKAKAEQLNKRIVRSVGQAGQLKNPDWRITFEGRGGTKLLREYCETLAGINTGDYPRFGRSFVEIFPIGDDWELQQSTTTHSDFFGGCTHLFMWGNGVGEYLEYVSSLDGRLGGSWKRGVEVWGRKGIAISQMNTLPIAMYMGTAFDSNVSVLIPDNEDDLAPIWCYLHSPSFLEEVRKIDQKLNVTNATLGKVPFDFEYWSKVAEEKFPVGFPRYNVLDATQWLFNGVISEAGDDQMLHVAMARLLGYRWPAELDPEKAGVEIEPSDEAHWELCASHVDDDGIVCLHNIRREGNAALRLRKLLETVFSDDGYEEEQLIAATGSKKRNFEDWLRDDFFAQHCKLFHNRPFIWHVWDGHPNGFHALLHYHQLDHETLGKLAHSYLGDWIRDQKQAVKNDVPGSVDRLNAAERLLERLEAIRKGEKPYDIFVRWKPLAEQPIGWNPDLNDGVRLNIRPFMIEDIPGGKTGAGILRSKPGSLHWNKDRGADPESAPWYHIFEGDRINDHHLSLEEKREAREITET